MEQAPYMGLTFDDVSLVTQYAEFLPEDTTTETRFSRNITLKIPFVSAAMDTVTEAPMAIAIAQLGGIGVVHKNLSIERQADEVRKVKQHANGLIQSPVIFKDSDTVGFVFQEKREKSYPFSGFPIVNASGALVGVLLSLIHI